MFSNDTENEDEIESHPEYEESTWGKNVDGQFVIDGFKFKGKQPFRKAKEDLQKLMERGVKGEIDGYTFILSSKLTLRSQKLPKMVQKIVVLESSSCMGQIRERRTQ